MREPAPCANPVRKLPRVRQTTPMQAKVLAPSSDRDFAQKSEKTTVPISSAPAMIPSVSLLKLRSRPAAATKTGRTSSISRPRMPRKMSAATSDEGLICHSLCIGLGKYRDCWWPSKRNMASARNLRCAEWRPSCNCSSEPVEKHG